MRMIGRPGPLVPLKTFSFHPRQGPQMDHYRAYFVPRSDGTFGLGWPRANHAGPSLCQREDPFHVDSFANPSGWARRSAAREIGAFPDPIPSLLLAMLSARVAFCGARKHLRESHFRRPRTYRPRSTAIHPAGEPAIRA